MQGLLIVNLIIGLVFVLCYGYQLYYILVASLAYVRRSPRQVFVMLLLMAASFIFY